MAYATVAQVRATDGMDDATTFPDDVITEAITWAEDLIDRYTGTSWTYKSFSTTLTGNNKRAIQVVTDEGRPILYIRTLTSVVINGVAATTTGWGLYPDGRIIQTDGTFDLDDNAVGRNITVAGTAGFSSSCPSDIAWCCRTLARQYAIDLVSRIPDRALQIQNDFGTVQIAQASGDPMKPTSLPEVNARLVRRRQWSDAAL